MKNAIRAWRLFRSKRGDPHVLFHAFRQPDGSRRRRVTTGRWLRAENNLVQNPGKKNGKVFVSGFHVLRDKDTVSQYIRRFKQTADLYIVPVWVRRLRRKPSSVCWLADRMYVKQREWIMALGAK